MFSKELVLISITLSLNVPESSSVPPILEQKTEMQAEERKQHHECHESPMEYVLVCLCPISKHFLAVTASFQTQLVYMGEALMTGHLEVEIQRHVC